MNVAAQILRRRKQCLVHRYLYYVRSESLVTDQQYDVWERELRALVSEHPDVAAKVAYDEDCPTRCVGSSNIWDYPRDLQEAAESLMIYNMDNLDWWARVTAPEDCNDEQGVELGVGQGPNLDTGSLF